MQDLLKRLSVIRQFTISVDLPKETVQRAFRVNSDYNGKSLIHVKAIPFDDLALVATGGFTLVTLVGRFSRCWMTTNRG